MSTTLYRIAIAAIALIASACTPGKQGFVASGLQYESDLLVCRSAIRMRGGDVGWDDRSAFSAAREEAGRRGLNLDACLAMLKESGEIAEKDLRGNREGTDPGAGETLPLKLQIFGKWEGVSENITGVLLTDSVKNGGNLEIRVERIGLRCSGKWAWVKGAYGSDLPPQGTWSITCDGGQGASGTYASYRPNEGIAEGKDCRGNRINMYFTEKEGAPHPTGRPI